MSYQDVGDRKISWDYIRGLIDGEGCFTFSKSGKWKVPAFILRMNSRDRDLIIMIKNELGLKSKIYEYDYQKNDGSIRDGQSILIVREFPQIKNVIVPFFYKKLIGHKRKQFEKWINEIGSDPDISDRFKLIYRMCIAGFYDRHNKFIK